MLCLYSSSSELRNWAFCGSGHHSFSQMALNSSSLKPFWDFTMLIRSKVVPSNEPNLLHSTGNAAQSPFVIAAKRAGIKVVPSIINFVVLTSAWSAGNSILLGSSRTLYGKSQLLGGLSPLSGCFRYRLCGSFQRLLNVLLLKITARSMLTPRSWEIGMAREGHAPKIFLRTSRMGIPYVAVTFISLFIALGYMTLSDGASVVFGWLQDLVSVAALIGWMVICTVYLRFYYGCKVQGIDRSELPWKAPFQPYAAWLSLVSFALLLLTGGYTIFIRRK